MERFTDPKSIYLRLSLTSNCNFFCRYCRPRSASASKPLGNSELQRLVKVIDETRPIRKLRFTGGEPLLRPNVVPLIASFKRLLPQTRLCLTTNGSLLKGRTRALRDAGIDTLNISLDTTREDRFEKLAGRDGRKRVMDGIARAHRAGFRKLKLNTVLLRSFNADDLGNLIRVAARYDCEIRFVELMPLGEGAALFEREFIPAGEALLRIKDDFPYLRPIDFSATARRHVIDVDGKEVTIGFISSVTDRFCSRCDRIRLDSHGTIYPCLRMEEGISLCNLKDDELRKRVFFTLKNKIMPDEAWPERSMAHMGG